MFTSDIDYFVTACLKVTWLGKMERYQGQHCLIYPKVVLFLAQILTTAQVQVHFHVILLSLIVLQVE